MKTSTEIVFEQTATLAYLNRFVLNCKNIYLQYEKHPVTKRHPFIIHIYRYTFCYFIDTQSSNDEYGWSQNELNVMHKTVYSK